MFFAFVLFFSDTRVLFREGKMRVGISRLEKRLTLKYTRKEKNKSGEIWLRLNYRYFSKELTGKRLKKRCPVVNTYYMVLDLYLPTFGGDPLFRPLLRPVYI